MKKKIFAIVGYTNWGKSNTLYGLFDRRGFQPLKSPIFTDRFPGTPFVVVNASNEDITTQKYLNRLKQVLQVHEHDNVVYFITISLIFQDNERNAQPVFDYLRSLVNYDVSYLVLVNGWYGAMLSSEDLQKMEHSLSDQKIIYFKEVINESIENFKIRTNLIEKHIASELTFQPVMQ